MDYEQALKSAKEIYEAKLEKLKLCNGLAKKIKSALPDGWEFDFGSYAHDLDICKGSYSSPDTKTDIGEFKLVCKIVEKILNKKLEKTANVGDDDEVNIIWGEQYYQSKQGTYIRICVTIRYPGNMPDCKIEWREKVIREAVISDECLGLNG